MASSGDRLPVSYIYDFNGITTSNTSSPLLSATLGSNNGEVPLTANTSDENYCLRWNDYEKKFAETFRVLRDDEFFTDVTITTEGHSVKAHRVILSACSNYFHMLLKSMSPWQHPVLVLHDVRTTDLNCLMDFIYFGQVSVNQDSLSSFLKVAERLKIKGLCETLAPTVAPAPPPLHVPPNPRNILNLPTVATLVSAPNFDNVLSSRSSYIQQSDMTPASTLTTTASTSLGSLRCIAPVAHQSPKHVGVRALSTMRSLPEPLMYISPKRTKYHALTTSTPISANTTGAVSPQSYLRNQLQQMQQQQKSTGNDASNVEVKAEPITILSSAPDEVTTVATSGVNVAEFITQDTELAGLPSLGHAIGTQFMFSPDALDNVVTAASVMPSNSSGSMNDKAVIAISVGGQPNNSSGGLITSLGDAGILDEPQDLTPVTVGGHSNTGTSIETVTNDSTNSKNSANLACVSPSASPNTTKRDRNCRRNCPYCYKDFHEMSLKRHIKDVHFRSNNTYVICPHCCKEYASQNSLYSHLNRVHGVKKDVINQLQLQLVTIAPTSVATATVGVTSSDTQQLPTDRIMDLAHHSDSSN